MENTQETLKGVQSRITNELYPHLSKAFEELESKRLIYGNGHHMAQQVQEIIAKMIAEQWAGK